MSRGTTCTTCYLNQQGITERLDIHFSQNRDLIPYVCYPMLPLSPNARLAVITDEILYTYFRFTSSLPENVFRIHGLAGIRTPLVVMVHLLHSRCRTHNVSNQPCHPQCPKPLFFTPNKCPTMPGNVANCTGSIPFVSKKNRANLVSECRAHSPRPLL